MVECNGKGNPGKGGNEWCAPLYQKGQWNVGWTLSQAFQEANPKLKDYTGVPSWWMNSCERHHFQKPNI